MKKFFPLILALCISCGSILAPKDTTVNVRYLDPEKKEFRTCTGIVVGLVRILTAEHCISKSEPMFVEEQPARVIKIEEDLALLEIQNPMVTKSIIKVAEKNPEVGEVVTIYGYAYAGPLMRFVRNVAGYAGGWMIVDGSISPGMSGGPVVNSKEELVGVNQSASESLGMVCNAKEIRDFLK